MCFKVELFSYSRLHSNIDQYIIDALNAVIKQQKAEGGLLVLCILYSC